MWSVRVLILSVRDQIRQVARRSLLRLERGSDGVWDDSFCRFCELLMPHHKDGESARECSPMLYHGILVQNLELDLCLGRRSAEQTLSVSSARMGSRAFLG